MGDTLDGHGGDNDDNATDILRIKGSTRNDTILLSETDDDRLEVHYQILTATPAPIDKTFWVKWRDDAGKPLVEQFNVAGEFGNDKIGFVSEAGKRVDFSALVARSDDWVGVFDGGPGDDELRGSDGRDLLYGGPDNDLLYGYAGDDRLWGNDGNDTLYAGQGNDDLVAGEGDNYLLAWSDDPRREPVRHFC